MQSVPSPFGTAQGGFPPKQVRAFAPRGQALKNEGRSAAIRRQGKAGGKSMKND